MVRGAELGGDPASSLTVSPTPACGVFLRAGDICVFPVPRITQWALIHGGTGCLLGSHPCILSPVGSSSGRGKVAFTASVDPEQTALSASAGKLGAPGGDRGLFCSSGSQHEAGHTAGAFKLGLIAGLPLEEVCSREPQGSVPRPDLVLGAIMVRLGMRRSVMCVLGWRAVTARRGCAAVDGLDSSPGAASLPWMQVGRLRLPALGIWGKWRPLCGKGSCHHV